MFPSFELFGKTIAVYPVMALIGLFAAGLLVCYLAKRRDLNVDDVIIFLLFCGAGALIGGHLLYGLTNFPLLIAFFGSLGSLSSFEEFMNGAVQVFGGSVFYGGLLGGIAAGCIYGRRKRISLETHADLMAPAVPLFHTFGRIGCFLGGCCYGIECPFGITYEHSLVPMANGVPRFPVQLAEAAFNLLLFAFLLWLLQRGAIKGRLFFLYLLLYSCGRFLLEFLRGDEYRGIWLGLSTSQWISLVLIAVSLGVFSIHRLKMKRQKCSEGEQSRAM